MPQQCPECARFLSKALVSGLATAPAPCPKCGTTLGPEMFSESVRPPDAPAVRPRDLPPAEVRTTPGDPGRDALAGWDEDRAGASGDVVDLARWREQNQGLAPESVALLVAGAGALGVAIGAVLSPSSRPRGAFVGAMLAAIAGVVATSRVRR
ncbi:MAG: hypothetical protein KY461_00175 [Actinobacteria bacterium]|nr:hypothetical protein [Actinomycetota bacterium]